VGRRRLFDKDADCAAFEALLEETLEKKSHEEEPRAKRGQIHFLTVDVHSTHKWTCPLFCPFKT